MIGEEHVWAHNMLNLEAEGNTPVSQEHNFFYKNWTTEDWKASLDLSQFNLDDWVRICHNSTRKHESTDGVGNILSAYQLRFI